jgi:hypothetical protein
VACYRVTFNINILHLVHIYFIVYPVVITSFNLCYSTYVIHTDSLSVTYFRFTIRPICISGNSEGSNKLPDDGRLVPKHVGAST